MPHMPQWLMKTSEMVASDRYFSLGSPGASGDRNALLQRYVDALAALQAPTYYQQSAAMRQGGMTASAVDTTLGSHFKGDWINAQYPTETSGGAFWPHISSETVLYWVKVGTMTAIHKAVGKQNLLAMYAAVPQIASYADSLYESHGQDGADNESVVPLSTSWLCVGPSDSTFFEADAVRAPSIVEFVIATPKPLGTTPTASRIGGPVGGDAGWDNNTKTWADVVVNLPAPVRPTTPPAS
jgi:hypothetical protein